MYESNAKVKRAVPPAGLAFARTSARPAWLKEYMANGMEARNAQMQRMQAIQTLKTVTYPGKNLEKTPAKSNQTPSVSGKRERIKQRRAITSWT